MEANATPWAGVTPAAGCMMRRKGTEEWHFISWIDHDEPISAADDATCWGGDVLLPAGPLTPEAALVELGKLPGAEAGDDKEALVWVPLETCFIEATTGGINIHPYTGIWGENNYEARGRDHAKEGQLRQWLSTQVARADEGGEDGR